VSEVEALDSVVWFRAGNARLADIIHSGQIFHWFEEKPYFYGLIDGEACVLEQVGRKILVHEGRKSTVRRFLGLSDSHHVLPSSILDEDHHVRAAYQVAQGVRLMNQPRWECLASFITSAMKQVSHIRQLSLKTRLEFGDRIDLVSDRVSESCLYRYPTPQQLAEAGSEALRRLGYGWRAETLHASAETVAKDPARLNRMAKLPTDELLVELQKFPGVGLKVASCVALFAYDRKEIFPLDVWTKRVLKYFYFFHQMKVSEREYLQKISEDFGSHAGYVQQLFFHAARTGLLKVGD